MKPINNPYYDAWLAADKGCLDSRSVRVDLIRQYGFAVPDEEAIRLLAALGPIVEMGAGLGYWASLIEQAGGSVDCHDRHPPDGNQESNHYRFTADPYHPIEEGSIEVLADHPASVLMLIWPCYSTPFAYDAVKAFKGDTIVYVGEGPYGCTGDDEFHALLAAEWEQDRHRIPTWDGIHDQLFILTRRSCDVKPGPSNPAAARLRN